MKFYCDAEKLNSALALVAKAVETNAVVPQMQGVLLSACGDELTLKGNNMETGIETTIPANTAEEGSVVINCRMLCDIARRLPNDVVEVAVNSKFSASISCVNSDYTVIGLPADEYPDIPQISSDCLLSVESSVLKDMINKTIFAVNTNPDEVRKPLKGSLFEAEGNELTVVAMDLVRMATVKKQIENSTGDTLKFIVPGKALNDLKSMLKDSDEIKVTIVVGENQVMFDCGEFKLTTRLIDGEYFAYKQIIPKQFKAVVTAEGRSLVKSIERVEPIIDDVSKNPIKLTFSNEKIKIKCETQLGRVNDIVDCDYEDDEMTIGFNYRYLHDALVRCEDENVELKINSPLSPIILECPEDESYMFMVLPVRL